MPNKYCIKDIRSHVRPDVLYAKQGDVVDVFAEDGGVALCAPKIGFHFATRMENLSDDYIPPAAPIVTEKPKRRR